MAEFYRGVVTRLDADGVYFQVASLGLELEFGPAEVASGQKVNPGDRVFVSTVTGTLEDLVIIGSPAAGAADPDSIDLGSVAGAVELDLSLGRIFKLTPTGAITSITLTNVPPAGKAVIVQLKVLQGTPAYTIATPTGGVFYTVVVQQAGKRCIFTYETDDGGATVDCSGIVQV